MDLEIAIIGVGLAGEQALELPLGDLGAQGLESGLRFGDDRGVAFCLAELDEAKLIVELALDPTIAVDGAVELVALAQQCLREGGLFPQLGVFRLGVQLVEAAGCVVPVKDASSAGKARHAPPRPLLESQRASNPSSHRVVRRYLNRARRYRSRESNMQERSE